MQVSIICVYNNSKQFQDQLQKTISEQDLDCEIIGIDNSNNCFTSAAAALNYGAKSAKGDILVFCHQDIVFKTENELSKFVRCIENLPVGSIVGGAASVELSKKNIGNYTSGEQYVPELANKYDKIVTVSAVDEAIFGMKLQTYNTHNFNEKMCDGWHLYAVEQCLYHRKQGNDIVLCPIEFHHFSGGKINLQYMKNILRIADHYKKNFKYIWTTCYKIRSNYLYTRSLYVLWVLNRLVKGNLK